jgi:hypothetical protein
MAIGLAIAGWELGKLIEDKFDVGGKLADLIFGATEERAKKVPSIVTQTMKDASLRLKGAEAELERNRAIAATKKEIARLDAATDAAMNNGSDNFDQLKLEQMLAENHLAELQRQKIPAMVGSHAEACRGPLE